MTIRSLPLLLLGIALMASAGALGGLLVHDGELGTDDRHLDAVGQGDLVRLKGEVHPVSLPEFDPNRTVELHLPDGEVVLLVGEDLPTHGTWVVEARVQEPLGTLLVLEATGLQSPYLFG